MAFTGTAVIKQISDGIAGVAIPAGEGTIGLSGATGTAPDVRLDLEIWVKYHL